MKIKPVDPKVRVRDPHSKQLVPVDGEEDATVPDDSIFWNRRLLDGSYVRATETAKPAPTGNEPIAALSTRGRS